MGVRESQGQRFIPEGEGLAMQGGRKSSDGQGAAVGGVALAAAQAIAAGKKVAFPLLSHLVTLACCAVPREEGS